MKVDRCICFKLSFDEILDICKEKDIKNLFTLQQREKLCNKCRRCNPYLKDMFITGNTKFDIKKS